jgi:8-oxo-dGTP diphosphatase
MTKMTDAIDRPVSDPILLVVAAALRRADGRVLLQRRVGGTHAGLWEFPGGKIDPGETPETALVRELREELAIAVDPANLRAVAFASSVSGSGMPLLLLLYRVDRWAGEPAALVADALCWTSPAAMASLPMPAPDYPLAASLAALPDEVDRPPVRD